ncbi:MAG: N-acetylmuramic acid 6-phosphate etherase [Planctomycetia bacterium]|nr:N-acetylmuramic acid 6-phosphate etherase [Planctomycetia bacterium]
MRFSKLPTEAVRPTFPPLDGGVRAVRALAASAARAAMTVAASATAVDRASDACARALRGGGTLLFFGAGTSGRLAVLEATELWPTFRVKARAEIAGGNRALLKAVEGAEDDARAGAEAMKGLRRGDVAVGVTASGVTPYVDGGLREARRRGAATVLVTCNPRTQIRAQVTVALPTGAEPLAGSTRMNAGTATKIALNAITTTAMAKAGKTWRNRMVDVVATNAKLRDRARRLVAELGEVSAARAEAILRQTASAKEGIAMARLGCGAGEARRRLRHAGGSLERVFA